MKGYNFKRRRHAEAAVEAARERVAGAVHSSRIRHNRPRTVPTPKLIGVTNSAVSFGDSVQVTIYASTSPGQAPAPVTPQRIETAWFDWLVDDSPEDIEGNTDVAIEPAEHGGYRLYHAACSARANR